MNLSKTFSALAVSAVIIGCITGCSEEAKAKRYLAKADRYFQQQEYSKAEVEYMNALRLSPQNPKIIRQLGYIYFEQAPGPRAFGALKEAKRLDPANADIRSRLATLSAGFGDITNSRSEARYILANQPTNTPALLTLVDTVQSVSDNSEIRREIDAFAEKHGLNTDVHVARAELEFRQRNLSAAEEHLKKAALLNSNSPAFNICMARVRLAQTNLAEGESYLKRAAETSPIRSGFRLHWVSFKMRTGDLPGARQILGNIIEKAPDYVPALNLLADLALTEKKFDECAKITTSVLKIDGESLEARLLRGRMFLAQDQPEKAIEELTQLENLYPRLPLAKYHLAHAHLRTGNTQKGMTALNQALQLQPGYTDAVILLAELNIRNKNGAAAIPPLVQLLRAHPEHVLAAQLLGTAYQFQGQNDAALRIYRDLASRFPKNPQFALLEGIVLRLQNKTAEARAAFDKSHALAPAFAPAVEQLVELDVLATNYPAALKRCAELAAVATNSAVPMLLEAKVHGTRKDFKAAEAAILRGLEREPDSLAASTFLAGLSSDLKDYDKALERLDAIIKLNPKAAAAWVQKGVIYQARNEKGKAQEAYRRAIEVSPSHAPALNNLAFLLSEETSQLDEALSLATRARQAAPTDAAVADTLGWIHYKRRNHVAARALFAEASEKLDVAEVQYHLGVTDYALSNEQSARQNLEKAIKNNLDPKLRDDAVAHLAVLDFNPATAKAAEIAKLEATAKRNPSDYLVQLRLADVYQRQNNFEKAQSAFEAAARANTQTSFPLLQLARLLSGRDDTRAYEIARNARKLDPNNPSVALTYGMLAIRRHDYSAALVALPEGLNAPEATPEASYALAVAQHAMGQIGPATATFQKLAANGGPVGQTSRDALTLINPTSSNTSQRSALTDSLLKADPNNLMALAARAALDEEQNQFKEAVGRYEKAVQLSTDFWPARRRLAYLYAERLNDDKSALPHATKVRQVAPDDAVTAHVLGKIAFRRNEFANALRYFQEAARGGAATGEPHYMVALTSLRLSRTNDSKAALSKALELPLPTAMSNDAKRLLAELK